MTFEDLKDANLRAYKEEKETGYPQVIMVPAKLIHLLINLKTEVDKDAEGENGEDANVSFETIEALNALDDYEMECEPCIYH